MAGILPKVGTDLVTIVCVFRNGGLPLAHTGWIAAQGALCTSEAIAKPGSAATAPTLLVTFRTTHSPRVQVVAKLRQAAS